MNARPAVNPRRPRFRPRKHPDLAAAGTRRLPQIHPCRGCLPAERTSDLLRCQTDDHWTVGQAPPVAQLSKRAPGRSPMPMHPLGLRPPKCLAAVPGKPSRPRPLPSAEITPSDARREVLLPAGPEAHEPVASVHETRSHRLGEIGDVLLRAHNGAVARDARGTLEDRPPGGQPSPTIPSRTVQRNARPARPDVGDRLASTTTEPFCRYSERRAEGLPTPRSPRPLPSLGWLSNGMPRRRLDRVPALADDDVSRRLRSPKAC